MYVPSPWRLSMNPWLSRERRASRTEDRLTRKTSASSRSTGSWSPDLNRPFSTMSLILETISSYTFAFLIGLNICDFCFTIAPSAVERSMFQFAGPDRRRVLVLFDRLFEMLRRDREE